METPLILHPLQWLDNLFVGNLFLQSLQGPGSKHEDEPGWAACVMQQLLLAIYFTYGNIYISGLLSQFVPPSPAFAVSTSLFSMLDRVLIC